MVWLYNIAISIYAFAIFLASFFNKKAKLWIDGRKGIFEQLEVELLGEEQEGRREEGGMEHEQDKKKSNIKLQTSKLKIIWMHVASLGEFEQGRPIIEKLKEQYPEL